MFRRIISTWLFRGMLIGLSALPTAAGAEPVSNSCTVITGQVLIDSDQFEAAIDEFTCVINADPTGVEGYRGRIEALVLLERYSDAVRDYQRIAAYVMPVNPNAKNQIMAGYTARLNDSPQNPKTLTGLCFARWWFFEYAQAIHLINQLVELQPDGLFPYLFRGSSRLLLGATKEKGILDLEHALELAPENPHVRFIVADAYTYGISDPTRAFNEAMIAFNGGLDTPRIHAILGTAYNLFGDRLAAAAHIKTSIDMVTENLISSEPLAARSRIDLPLVPGRTYDIPVPASSGQVISINTGSRDFADTIAVLLAPDETPVFGADDDRRYFASFNFPAPVSGTYTVRITSFESIATGIVTVHRK